MSFHRVNESLAADNGRSSVIGLLVGALLAAAWLVWAFACHVTRYEISDSARLEAAGYQEGTARPNGRTQVSAEFDPSALGKLRTGERAIVRFPGFTTAEYGSISAHISRIAWDVHDGRVRVELAIDHALRPSMSLQDGLRGSVEVEVERVTPAVMLLRSAGAVLDAH